MKGRTGFTLIELIVTIALIAILAIVIMSCIGCGGGGGATTNPTETATVSIKIGVASNTTSVIRLASVLVTDIKTIKVTISGSYMNDMTDSFAFNSQATVTKTYQVPTGLRTFYLEGKDVDGKTIFDGKTTQQINPGANSVKVDLYPTAQPGQGVIDITIPNVPASIGPIYGMCFSPYKDGQSPSMLIQIPQSQLSERLAINRPWCQAIRTYGCTYGLENTGQLAKALGLYVIIGVWLSSDKTANATEVANAIAVANAGGCDVICVGSENQFRADISEAEQIAYMKQIKNAVNVPVTTDDTGNALLAHPAICAECEGMVLANIYPYWKGVSVDQAVEELELEYNALVSANPGKEIIIGETGWPTAGNTIGQAVPNEANARKYFTDVITWARSHAVKIYWFEAFDEKWKATTNYPQEANWGIFTNTGVMKTPYHEVMF